MQPDLGSPQQDDKQPEPPPMHEAPPSIPAPAQVKKQPKRNIAAIILGLFAFVLLLAVAGLGFWAFSLNTKLTAAQQELTALQGEPVRSKQIMRRSQVKRKNWTQTLPNPNLTWIRQTPT